jgi:hypothetical protein
MLLGISKGIKMKKQKLTFWEIFEAVDKAPRKDRVAVLHLYSCVELKQLLNLTFNPKVKWLVPPGTPPFKPVDGDLGSMVYSLRQQHNFRKLNIFFNSGQYDTLAPAKREQTFIDLLGAIHPTDAKLLVAIKDRETSWPFKNITPALIKEAFPMFTSNWETKVK